MRTEDITKEIEKTLIRYRSGNLSLEQTKTELGLLMVMIRAYDLVTLEQRMDQIEKLLEERR
jgi:hypothetical protein